MLAQDGDAEVATEAITSAVTHAIMDHLAKHPAEGLSKMAFSHVTGIINELPVFKQLGIGHALQGVTDTIGKGVDGVLGGLGRFTWRWEERVKNGLRVWIHLKKHKNVS